MWALLQFHCIFFFSYPTWWMLIEIENVPSTNYQEVWDKKDLNWVAWQPTSCFEMQWRDKTGTIMSSFRKLYLELWSNSSFSNVVYGHDMTFLLEIKCKNDVILAKNGLHFRWHSKVQSFHKRRFWQKISVKFNNQNCRK